ncbi:hypothetical protein FDE94_08925 [Clostridium botulinum]|nr:hypothetical protein [Clostridium botulinum]
MELVFKFTDNSEDWHLIYEENQEVAKQINNIINNIMPNGGKIRITDEEGNPKDTKDRDKLRSIEIVLKE